ncbi:hypothetical protein [Pedobacter sp. P26]|uniref:hypothetical protein n=1 Tax=Pedobacter sp. P26 TaxID=3423956 RepID=UPI003D66A18B
MRSLKLVFLIVLFPAMIFAQEGLTVIDQQKIIDDEINSVIYKDKAFKQPVSDDPDWKKIRRNISKKYRNANAGMIINASRIKYYKIKNEWDKFSDAYLTSLEKYDPVEKMTNYRQLSWSVNNTLYSLIFKNVNDKKLLLRAAIQSKKIIENPNSIRAGEPADQYSANNIDTYSNLLYKAGKSKKAIEWQTKAVEYTNGEEKEFKSNLEKMKKGEKTW